MQVNRQNLKWIGRMALILVLVAAAEALVSLFVHRPFAWYLIPALLPLLTCVCVILPMIRAKKPAPPSA